LRHCIHKSYNEQLKHYQLPFAQPKCQQNADIILGVWALYNTIRYFLAFTTYNPADGQAVSLALGISTGVSFALLICALILSIFQPYLLLHRVPLRTLLFTQKGFDALSSFFLSAPAVYNLVMTFIWRNSTNPELNFRHRCHLDIDVVWSVSKAQCQPRVWGTWLALSIVRLVLTLLIIVSSSPILCFHAHIVVQIAYHMISYRIGRPTYPTPHRYHYRHRSQLSESQSSLPPSFAAYLPSYDFPSLPGRLPQHQSSDSTLSSLANSKHSSSQQSPRALRPHTSISTLYSDEDTSLDAETNEHNVHQPEDQELNSFTNRFRALISRITRETEVGIEVARSDTALDHENSNLYVPPVPPAVGYDEFGRPYPPEEQVSFLNGYVRRMPTIESMGSREVGSTITSKGMTTSRRSTGTFSRPPTRSNTLTVSECSSASNNISHYGEISTALGRTNEMGELVDKGSEENHDASRRGSGVVMSGQTTSTSTMSYYTATSSSSAVPPASDDTLPQPGIDGIREHVKINKST
jgi:hypothetical protein